MTHMLVRMTRGNLVKFSGLIALTLLSLIGCTTPSIPITDPQEKMNIASNILSEAVYVSTLLSECQTPGSDVELEALSLEQDWLLKNWPLIAAADRYYTEQEQASGILYQGTLLSLPAIKLAHDAKLRALNELNFSKRTAVNQQKFCMNRLATLAKNEMDLTAQANGKPLPFVSENQTAEGPMQTAAIPTLAGNFMVNQDPGKTYYKLVDQLGQDCPELKLVVLVNNWPQEAYAAYCDGAALTLMVCEWGTCERRVN